jgi:hypothetical protein
MVLLLGSYDNKTKPILDSSKEEIERVYAGEVFTAVLSNLELYDTENFQVLTETNEEKKIMSIYLISDYGFQEAYDLPLPSEDKRDEYVRNFLKKKYGLLSAAKEPTAYKLDNLIRAAEVIFLIRHKEETRGGEYVELMYALNKGYAGKIWFFKNEGIILSSMLMEYMDMYKVTMRTYFKLEDLKSGVLRVLEYFIVEEE